MKNFKKILSLALCAVMIFTIVAALASCQPSKPTIGIMKFGSHASLNNCYDGIIKGLSESGIDLDAYNVEMVDSNFDSKAALSQAKTFVNKRASVIIAIATPTAIAAATEADGSGIPVVYCAITDKTVMENYKNVTGASDIPNFEKQLETVTQSMGKTNLKIGVLYSTDESSSPFQVSELKKAAEKYEGMTIADKAVAKIETIDTEVNALISEGVDCFVNLLDNTIVGKLQSNILPITNDANIPVFGSEVEQVKVGCAASASIDYISVGKSAGEAAAAILKGEKKADDIPVSVISDPTVYYNKAVCDKLGIAYPENAKEINE